MSKFDDKQVDITIQPNNKQTTQIHAPAGSTPAHGADAPFVAPTVAGYSGGGNPITPIAITVAGTRFANPA